MRRQIILTFVTVFLSFLLFSCNKTLITPDISATLPVSTNTTSPLTITTSTAVNIQATNSHIENSKPQLRIDCISINNFIKDKYPSGTIVLKNPYSGSSVYYNLNTKVETPILHTKAITPTEFAVSPDGHWLAYKGASDLDSSTISLIVRSSDGGQIFKFSMEYVEFANIAYWLNNKWIVLQRVNVDGLDWLVLLNPFTGDKQALLPNFPNIYFEDKNWLWPTLTIYNPSLEYVAYVKYPSSNHSNSLVLWNKQKDNKVVEITNYIPSMYQPLWSPDGKHLVLVKIFENQAKSIHELNHELISLNIDGTITQLTDLSAYYGQASIYTYSWSPNGRYIAFWLQTNNQNKVQGDYVELAVLDLYNLVVTNYCIASYRSDTPPPIWSSDSEYLAIGTFQDYEKNFLNTILVNIQDGTAENIAENMLPQGWLIGIP